MKKFISLLLCVALLCSMVVVVAHADDEPQVQVANAVAIPGASVTLDLNLVNNPGVASLKLIITDSDDLGVTFAGADYEGDTLGLTTNDAKATYFWSGAYDDDTSKVGTLTITIPDTAAPGEYTFDVTPSQSVNTSNEDITFAAATFTITVSDKVIDGVNVAIDAGLAIGIHVQISDPESTSITAVDVVGEEFITVEDYVEDEENGGYIYYLNVNPWDMDKVFTVDFTESFDIDGDKLTWETTTKKQTVGDEQVEVEVPVFPATAKTISVVEYCAKVKGTSDELDQLIADMLAFGQQAQAYKEMPVTITIPEGLAATEAAWENGDGEPCSFGDYCSENFPEDINKKNATAMKKFVFDYATIEFGSKFVATFTFANGATETASNLARVKVNGETYSLDGWNFVYSFSPAEYAGVEFDLYANGNSTTATNFAWINNYGPAHFAAYLNDNYGEAAADILAVLEAFYNYGVSVETYAATLG